jgi:hypothetical protein
VQTFAVIYTFQKVFNSTQRIIAISIAIQLDFLALQHTYEAFRDCIVVGITRAAHAYLKVVRSIDRHIPLHSTEHRDPSDARKTMKRSAVLKPAEVL